MYSKMKNWMTAGLIMTGTMLIAPSAHAELSRSLYANFYLGPDFTAASDVETQVPTPGGPVAVAINDIAYKTDLTIGGRVGYWHNSYWGAALDIFSYGASNKSQTVNASVGSASGQLAIDEDAEQYSATALGFDVMARYPLTDTLFPYIGIGPAVYMNSVHSNLGGDESSATNVGFSAPLGIQYNVLTRENVTLGLFSEVKLTYNPTKITESGSDVTNTLFTTHLLFGLSLAYNL